MYIGGERDFQPFVDPPLNVLLMGFLIKMGPPHFLRSTKCHVEFAFHESYPQKLMLPATHLRQGDSRSFSIIYDDFGKYVYTS